MAKPVSKKPDRRPKIPLDGEALEIVKAAAEARQWSVARFVVWAARRQAEAELAHEAGKALIPESASVVAKSDDLKIADLIGATPGAAKLLLLFRALEEIKKLPNE